MRCLMTAVPATIATTSGRCRLKRIMSRADYGTSAVRSSQFAVRGLRLKKKGKRGDIPRSRIPDPGPRIPV